MNDQNPFVLITVKNYKNEVIFFSSDPAEISKQNLNGLAKSAYIDIDSQQYIISELSITILTKPIDFKYGIDLSGNEHRGVATPYICDIKIKTEQ